MAKTLKKHPINENITENIITDNLEEILGQRFGRYSKYISNNIFCNIFIYRVFL